MFSLTAYTVTINAAGSKKHERLDKFDGSSSLLKVMHSFISTRLGNDVVFAHKKRVMRYTAVDPLGHDSFVASIQTGEYGFTSDIYDTASQTSAHLRSKTEAEMLPFFLFAYMPPGKNKGVLVFQRFKQFGVRGYFMDEFYANFAAQFPGYSLKLAKAVPAAILAEILGKGQVKVFRFVKYQASSDICDAMSQLDQDATTTEVEYVIKAKRNSYFGLLEPLKNEFTKAVPDFKSIVEIPNFDYDTIRVDIDIAGRRRSVDLGKLFKISANVDITDDVDIDVSGHPKKVSFKKLAEDLSKTILP
ncbi:MAG: hypothetical protein ACXV5N_11625 [Halobacteriota archaeon]